MNHHAGIKEIGQLLLQMAWADGQVQQAEIALIDTLLRNLGLPLSERLPLLDESICPIYPTDTPLEPTGIGSQNLSRPTLMELLVRVCFADMQAGDGELALLTELALRWGISAEQLEQFRLKATGGRH